MASKALQEQVATTRRFNRFYTRHVGLLQEHLARSDFTLTEARVIYELAHCKKANAKDLGAELGIDAGYLSRLLQRFRRQGLVTSTSDARDARVVWLRLTAQGRKAFERLNRNSADEVAAWLRKLSAPQRAQLVQAMNAVEAILSGSQVNEATDYTLRGPASGDFGWVVQRHGVLYAHEYGWDENFEALVAQIMSDFVKNFKPRRERCWIAERNGENVGCVFVIQKNKTTAQLRCLLVEPTARGLGIGRRLVDECIAFARHCGYRKMILWTNDVLHSARRIYQAAGFTLAKEERHHSYGHDLVGQYWELAL